MKIGKKALNSPWRQYSFSCPCRLLVSVQMPDLRKHLNHHQNNTATKHWAIDFFIRMKISCIWVFQHPWDWFDEAHVMIMKKNTEINIYVGRTGIVNQGVKGFFSLFQCERLFIFFSIKKMCIHKGWVRGKNEFWKNAIISFSFYCTIGSKGWSFSWFNWIRNVPNPKQWC